MQYRAQTYTDEFHSEMCIANPSDEFVSNTNIAWTLLIGPHVYDLASQIRFNAIRHRHALRAIGIRIPPVVKRFSLSCVRFYYTTSGRIRSDIWSTSTREHTYTRRAGIWDERIASGKRLRGPVVQCLGGITRARTNIK